MRSRLYATAISAGLMLALVGAGCTSAADQATSTDTPVRASDSSSSTGSNPPEVLTSGEVSIAPAPSAGVSETSVPAAVSSGALTTAAVPAAVVDSTAPSVVAAPSAPGTAAENVPAPPPASQAPGVPAAPSATPSPDPAVRETIGANDLLVISGTYDLRPLIIQRTPVIIETTTAPLPTDVTVVQASAGNGSAIAGPGSTVGYVFRMASWRTGDVYDSTPAGEASTVVIGATPASRILEAALVGASPGAELIITYPVGSAGLPDFVPEDDAYVMIVSVVSVTA